MTLDSEQDLSGTLNEPSWSGLVEKIKTGDRPAMEELYRLFSKGIRFLLCRQLGPQDLDDRVHDLFLVITQSIQRGDLREPERLMGYVRTIVRRQIAAQINQTIHVRQNETDLNGNLVLTDTHPNPEKLIIEEENMGVALNILNSLRKREREVLIRFYLKEQTPAQICADLDLTETQFRLIKSRAKARFGELGRRRMARRRGFDGGNGSET